MMGATTNLTIACLLALGAANNWDIGASSTLTVSGAVTNNGKALTIQGNGNTTITSTNWGTGGLIKNGGGTLTLNGAQPGYTGNVVIYGGTVSAVGGTGFGGVLGQAATIRILNGGTLYSSSGDNGAFGNPGTLIPGAITVLAGGTLKIGSGVTAHIPRPLVLTGGELSSSGTINATYGSWNLEQGVTVNGGIATSVISAKGIAVNQAGGTIFNVGRGAASGVDVDVTGYIGHFPSTADNGLIKSGAGVMRLSGVDTYTGNTTISNRRADVGQLGLDFQFCPNPRLQRRDIRRVRGGGRLHPGQQSVVGRFGRGDGQCGGGWRHTQPPPLPQLFQ
jgi:autotransporter-associated beta strand protein